MKRLGRSNYHQFLVAKRVGTRLRLSADYTSDSGADTLRQAITIRIPEIRVADSLHFEQYERPGRQSGYGFSAYGERKLGAGSRSVEAMHNLTAWVFTPTALMSEDASFGTVTLRWVPNGA